MVNLADLEGQYEQAEASSGFAPIPDGTYHVQIQEASLGTAKESGARMISWKFLIVGPSFANRNLFKNSVLESKKNPENNQKMLGMVKGEMQALGFNYKLSEWPEKLAELINGYAEVYVKNKGKDSQGRDQTAVYLKKRLTQDQLQLPDGEGDGTNDPF